MAAVDKERPLHELLSHDMVDIYVGPSNTHWTLHKKLLCHRSPFFRNIFHPKRGCPPHAHAATPTSVYGLPDDDDEPFRLFVAWLYSDRVPAPRHETDLTPLLDLSLMAERWDVRRLILDALDAVRRYYRDTDSWPSLRRVQYVYANAQRESPLRRLLVRCAARMLVTGPAVPAHWEKALRSNGDLAVDVILCVQMWRVDPERVPDARAESVEAVVVGEGEGAEAEAEGKGMRVSDDQTPVVEEEEEDEDNVLDWGVGKTYNGDASRSQSQSPSQAAGTGGESDADKTLVNGH